MGNPDGVGTDLNEPFDGFLDADIPTITKQIDGAPEGEREALKAAIRDAEYRLADYEDRAPRAGVIDATEPVVVNPPAPAEPEAELPPGDSSGLPPLNEVAEDRAANTRESVIDLTTPKED